MYGVDDNFWLILFTIIITILVLNVLFSGVMRRKLKVEKKKFFSYNHVNERHSKVDWWIRISFVILITIGLVVNIMTMPAEIKWYREPWPLLLTFIIVSEIVRASFERKYATNRNDYIFTIGQLVFNIVLVAVVLSSFYIWLA